MQLRHECMVRVYDLAFFADEPKGSREVEAVVFHYWQYHQSLSVLSCALGDTVSNDNTPAPGDPCTTVHEHAHLPLRLQRGHRWRPVFISHCDCWDNAKKRILNELHAVEEVLEEVLPAGVADAELLVDYPCPGWNSNSLRGQREDVCNPLTNEVVGAVGGNQAKGCEC